MKNEDLIKFENRLERWTKSHAHREISSIGHDVKNFLTLQTREIVNSQYQSANNIIASQDRIGKGIDELSLNIKKFEERIAEGFEGLLSSFNWGFSEVVWQLEQTRNTLVNIVNILEKPLDTQAKELKRRAQEAYINGWYDEALEDFLESEKKNRYDFTIHHYIGNIYFFHKRNPEKALEYYQNAVKYSTPKSPYHACFSLLHIGLLYYLQEDYENAYNSTLKAIELNVNLPEAYYQHAQYCANLGEYDEAISYLDFAVSKDNFYCIKADRENDFNIMKDKLLAYFDNLRNRSKDSAQAEIKIVNEYIKLAEKYNALNYEKSNRQLKKAKECLDNAKKYFNRDSFFDYLDSKKEAINAHWLALESSELAINDSINSLNQDISKLESDSNDLRSKDKRKKDGVKNFLKDILYGLGIIIFTIPILWAITLNLSVSILINFIFIAILNISLLIYANRPFSNSKEKDNNYKISNIKSSIEELKSRLSIIDNYKHTVFLTDENFLFKGCKVSYLKFYEEGSESIAHENRKYNNKFPKSQSRYICWELDLEHPAPGEKIDFSITAVWYRQNGNVLGQQELNSRILDDWEVSWRGWGWGWEEPGNWKIGFYKVEIFIEYKLIGSGIFEIY